MRFLLLLPLFWGVAATAQRLNTDAIDAFWRVVDRLERDKPLTDSLWNAYYDLPGNKAYMHANRPAEEVAEHRRYLEFVFRPSVRDSLKTLPDQNDDILDNLVYIRDHEAALRAYTDTVVLPAYLSGCRDLALQYLPKGKHLPIPSDLTIYIMAIAFDGAFQGSHMYFGIARVYEYDRFRKGALAGHELHHQMRVDDSLRRPVTADDSAAFTAVDLVNNEGSADLIDKMLVIDNPGQVFRAAGNLHRLMDRAPAAIRALDSCFRRGSGDYDAILNYSSGHLPGMYMADVIRRGGLTAELVAHDDNPFRFFYYYNQAAALDPRKPPVFSAEAMGYLRGLEKRCIAVGNYDGK